MALRPVRSTRASVVWRARPEDILQKLSDGVIEAYQTPKIQQLHENFDIPSGPVGLEEARRHWRDEAPQWVAIADRLGIKLD